MQRGLEIEREDLDPPNPTLPSCIALALEVAERDDDLPDQRPV